MFFGTDLLNLFDNVFEDTKFSTMNIPDVMRTDISELDGKLLLEIELPGYEKKDVTAQLSNGYLTIMATRSKAIEQELKKRHYIKRERYIGSCKRSYFVGGDTKQEDIQAAFKDGMLRILVNVPNGRLEDTRKLIEIK